MILSIRKIPFIALLFCSVSLLTSCTEEKFLLVVNRVKVKNYPVDTPFVYNSKINITNNINKDEKTRLQENLVNYWADSLYARRLQKFGISYSIKNPPVFDTANINPTINFMNGYLFSQGYFNTVIKDSFYVDTVFKGNKPPQYRTTVVMDINAGNRVTIDSLGYDLRDSTLQRITLHNKKDSKIEPGKTFYSKEVIAAELDRLVTLYRKRGYFLMRRNNIAAVVDTLNPLLLKLTLDPFEQVRILEQAKQQQQEKPAVTVTIEQRRLADTSVANKNDTAFLKRFHIGNIHYYPDVIMTEFPDSLINYHNNFKREQFKGYSVYSRSGEFKPTMFRQFNYVRSGQVYNEDNFLKTVNTFGQVGAWKQVDTRTLIRGDSVDLYYFLYPDKKQNITYNLEASRNTGDVLTTSNFFGLALNVTYRNRNLFHSAIQSTTSFTSGVEFTFNKAQTANNNFWQAFQIAAGQTFSFPSAFMPFKPKSQRRPDFGRTVVSFNGAYADRKDYFRLRSLVADYGYDWKNKNKVWQVRFPNIEIYLLDTLPLLIEAFNTNPFLRNSFNTGRIISTRGSLILSYPGRRNITNYVRFSSELCIPGLNYIDDRIYQYVKLEAEYRKTIALHKSFVAMRAFAGVGYNYHVSPSLGVTLPFYKQFIAGGPNSMRAWGLRQLGLGSSLLSDTSTTFRDRYGDMQMEANLEYRFPIAHYSSVNINGGVFADAGNIWNVRDDPNNPEGSFDINRLGKDIALGIGTGLRMDFSYFLIRVDFGIKMRDPARLANNGWLDIANFTWRNTEFDKYDDQGNLIGPKRNNYAIQLGIGLPF